MGSVAGHSEPFGPPLTARALWAYIAAQRGPERSAIYAPPPTARDREAEGATLYMPGGRPQRQRGPFGPFGPLRQRGTEKPTKRKKGTARALWAYIAFAPSFSSHYICPKGPFVLLRRMHDKARRQRVAPLGIYWASLRRLLSYPRGAKGPSLSELSDSYVPKGPRCLWFSCPKGKASGTQYKPKGPLSFASCYAPLWAPPG